MRKAYPTDLTDDQWAMMADVIPPAVPKPGCAPTDLREVVNTLLYQNRSGCQWNLLPHDLLPKSTVHDYYRRWRADGTWDRLLDARRRAVRRQAGRTEEPTAGAMDSQSAATTAVGGDGRGYDGGKKVKGRKRHILTDSIGLLLAVVVTAANVSDGRAAPAVLTAAAVPTRLSLRVIWADARYHDTVFRAHLKRFPHLRLEIVSRPPGSTGFVLLPRRWVVERTFAWLQGYRRLSKDYERLPESSESRVKVAAIHTMLKRLTRDGGTHRPMAMAESEANRKAA